MKKILIILLIPMLLCSCGKKECGKTVGIVNQKETQYTIKAHDIIVNSNQEITVEQMNQLKKYEITVNVNNNFDIYEAKYIGVKLTDFLNLYEKEYSILNAVSRTNKMINYSSRKLPANAYVVFNKDGKELSQIVIANFDLATNYWLYDLTSISFYQGGV